LIVFGAPRIAAARPTHGIAQRFHEAVVTDAIRFLKLRKLKRWLKSANHDPMERLEAYSFFGLSEGV
jgi:hypothetical protein